MSGSRALGAVAVGWVLLVCPVPAQTTAHYRDFQLGGNLPSVSALTGVPASDAKTVHTRPAILQSLEWRLPYAGSSETGIDPVRQIAFSFYNDQLYRLIIEYDRDRTEGMTDADMVEAISTMYGAPLKQASPTTRAPLAVIDQASGTRLGRWGDGEYTALLYRSSYAGFRMVVTSIQLEALARTAEAQALRLDERDAPQRERARQMKQAEAERAAKEKARLANKAAFKP